MPLVVVSDEQVLASIIVECVVLLACVGGIGLNLYKLIYVKGERNKFVRVILLIVFITCIVFLLPVFHKDVYMYSNYKIVEGRIIDFCKTEKNEDGVQFIYKYNGQDYTNCNVYFPFPKDSISFNKSYKIRVNIVQPEDGRIILE
ncbi:MAG: hypothetical protein OHK0036_03350 [Bacteroidia bacterium]